MPQFMPRSRPFAFAALLVATAGLAQASFALDNLDFTVTAGDEDLRGRVRDASLLLALEPEQTAPDEILAAARAEYGRLIGALYAAGHYSPVISVRLDGREAASIAPLDGLRQIGRVQVTVDPGPVFRFSQAEVRPLAPGTELPDGFAAGKTAESGLVREAVTAGVDGWRNVGHAKAEVAGQDIVADHRANSLSARVQIAPGPKLRFGPVAVTGNERTRERRVRKIAGLPEGKVYSPAEMKRAADRLRRTGTFKSVAIEEDEAITSPDLLGTTIVVVEEKLRRLTFGAEISSLEGATLSAAWMHRNLFRGAERVKVDAEVRNIGAPDSGIDYGIGLAIDRPATLTPDTTLRFSTRFERLDDQDSVANVLDVKIGFTHYFSDTLTGRVDLSYEYETGTAFSTTGGAPTDFTYRSVSLPTGLTWDRRDSKTDATRGFYVDAEVKPFVGLGQTGTGARLYTDLRGYRGFGEDARFVVAARVQIGAVLGADLLEVQRDDLFYSGGGGTVRGQPYQSLGVTVSRGLDDYKIGGSHFLGTSLELRAKVSPKIGVVGFVDAGRVDVDGFFQPSGDWHAGAGLGLRYDTGVGPIRFDIAGPVGGTTGKGVQIYVGLGQAF